VSRIVGRLKALFATWQSRDLSSERYPIVFLDGFHLKVRVARRVVSVPVLAALGVTETGQKCLLTLRVAASEASATWGAAVTDLQQRGLVAPLLLWTATLGSGTREAVGWRARPAVHHAQMENLRTLPHHAQAEMKRDYHRLLCAADGLAARAAYEAFVKKVVHALSGVPKSLEEAGLGSSRSTISRSRCGNRFARRTPSRT
jgi:transposase-like protein